MRQKKKSRVGRDLLDGIAAKTEAANAPQCQLPRVLGAKRESELDRLVTFDQEAEIERLLDDLTAILLEAEMIAHPEGCSPNEPSMFARAQLLKKRRRCGEA